VIALSALTDHVHDRVYDYDYDHVKISPPAAEKCLKFACFKGSAHESGLVPPPTTKAVQGGGL